jgi:formate hydrogenlyase subunit 4
LFLPIGLAAATTPLSLGLGLLAFGAKVLVLSLFVVVVETVNAKLRLFRVPDLLSASFVLAALALLSTFLFG